MSPWAPTEEVCIWVRLSNMRNTNMARFLGQAQYIRVPYADFNALKLPAGKKHEADFILLAGEFPMPFLIWSLLFTH